MFKKVLIANRGEVALRIIRACRELGMQSALVYSEPDRDSLPVFLADEAVCIGPAATQDSYLNVSRVLSAAEITKADALHPGYGFLADSPEFAEATISVGLTFVGPEPDIMRRVQDKVLTRQLAREHGLPVVPGSAAEVADAQEATRVGSELGYPVLVKAATGCGNTARHVVRRDKDIETGYRMCQAEAKASFGDGRVYIEKLLANPRHIEVQVLADRHGHVLALPERDCSVQFRFRKLVEESPSPAVSAELRQKLADWSVTMVRSLGLTCAATAEFLLDEKGDCHFLKVDSRLHIEHGLTELVTGIDIVHEQFRAAAGDKLQVKDGTSAHGHAIECRIRAEDPDAGFEPSSGIVAEARLPSGPGVRVDSYLAPGSAVPQLYDTLVAKVMAWAQDRTGAIARMDRALSEVAIVGVTTTTSLHRRLMKSGRFRRGKLAAGMLDEELAS